RRAARGVRLGHEREHRDQSAQRDGHSGDQCGQPAVAEHRQAPRGCREGSPPGTASVSQPEDQQCDWDDRQAQRHDHRLFRHHPRTHDQHADQHEPQCAAPPGKRCALLLQTVRPVPHAGLPPHAQHGQARGHHDHDAHHHDADPAGRQGALFSESTLGLRPPSPRFGRTRQSGQRQQGGRDLRDCVVDVEVDQVDGHRAGEQAERSADPGEERSFVGQRETRIGFVTVAEHRTRPAPILGHRIVSTHRQQYARRRPLWPVTCVNPAYRERMASKPKSPAVELEVGDHTVRLSNPDRVYFPKTGATKLDLANYYISVGDGIVRALRERPCMLHRFPDGVAGEKVHQKRVPHGAPEWLETVRLHFPRYNRQADELCVPKPADVLWAVQMSTVEFHPWNSRRADTEKPDEWRIDLDPMPECPFDTVRRVAGSAREVLDELGITGYPKTSGGHGLHIHVRITPDWECSDVRPAAPAFAKELERRNPDDVTTAWWRKDRSPRDLFVDFNQNARDHTMACAYSVRGTPDATVSTPFTWDELDDIDPRDCTMATVPKRFAELGDVHEGIDDEAFSLAPLLEWAERDEAEGDGLGE